MDFIVSAERAIAEGTSAYQLDKIAEWHDGQAVQAERGSKSRKPNPAAANRHRRIAAKLRAVGDEVAAELDARAAA